MLFMWQSEGLKIHFIRNHVHYLNRYGISKLILETLLPLIAKCSKNFNFRWFFFKTFYQELRCVKTKKSHLMHFNDLDCHRLPQYVKEDDRPPQNTLLPSNNWCFLLILRAIRHHFLFQVIGGSKWPQAQREGVQFSPSL